MKLGQYFFQVTKDLEYQQWEREMQAQVKSRTDEVLAEQDDDTKWKAGFVEGMKHILADPHKRIAALDTETPEAKG